MKRTQIYLRQLQKEELEKLAVQKNKALAELIREAVDIYITENKLPTDDYIITSSGIWKDRDDLNSGEYVNDLRNELNTRLEDF